MGETKCAILFESVSTLKHFATLALYLPHLFLTTTLLYSSRLSFRQPYQASA